MISLVVARFCPTSSLDMVAYGLVDDLPDAVVLLLCSWLSLRSVLLETHAELMICDMENWAKSFPAPANYVVISGDNALSSTLKKLHSQNYNILVAHPHGHKVDDLVAPASCVWEFETFIRGRAPYLVRPGMVPRSFACSKELTPKGKPTLVLWDLRSCPFPTEAWDYLDLLDIVRSSISKNCSCSRITMVGYGVDDDISDFIVRLFCEMSLISDLPETHAQRMISEMEDWAKSVPAPANYVVISGDNALSSTLKKLHIRNYNILVAHPHGHWVDDLVATASCVWEFETLIDGGLPYLVRKEMVPRSCKNTGMCRTDERRKLIRKDVGSSKLSLEDIGRCQTTPRIEEPPKLPTAHVRPKDDRRNGPRDLTILDRQKLPEIGCKKETQVVSKPEKKPATPQETRDSTGL